MATATTEPVRLPPGPRIPKTVQGIAFLTALCEVVPALGRRCGNTFTIKLPVFGTTVAGATQSWLRKYSARAAI